MIFLIGMMGSGKTLFGKMLADALKVEHYDTDDLVITAAGQSITDIFEIHGEQKFREYEKKVLNYICKNFDERAIISTGGGIILDFDNIVTMKKHGKVIFLNRDIDDIILDIEADKRPLIKKDKANLYKIYNERIELYKKYADFEVLSRDINQTCLQLLDYINKGG